MIDETAGWQGAAVTVFTTSLMPVFLTSLAHLCTQVNFTPLRTRRFYVCTLLRRACDNSALKSQRIFFTGRR